MVKKPIVIKKGDVDRVRKDTQVPLVNQRKKDKPARTPKQP
jgi:hypothetical protein